MLSLNPPRTAYHKHRAARGSLELWTGGWTGPSIIRPISTALSERFARRTECRFRHLDDKHAKDHRTEIQQISRPEPDVLFHERSGDAAQRADIDHPSRSPPLAEVSRSLHSAHGYLPVVEIIDVLNCEFTVFHNPFAPIGDSDLHVKLRVLIRCYLISLKVRPCVYLHIPMNG